MIEKPPSFGSSASCQVYHAYLLNDDGHFMGVFELFCQGDEDVVNQAHRLADGRTMEIWKRNRRVAPIPASQFSN